jgi:hypothetical protein
LRLLLRAERILLRRPIIDLDQYFRLVVVHR